MSQMVIFYFTATFCRLWNQFQHKWKKLHWHLQHINFSGKGNINSRDRRCKVPQMTCTWCTVHSDVLANTHLAVAAKNKLPQTPALFSPLTPVTVFSPPWLVYLHIHTLVFRVSCSGRCDETHLQGKSFLSLEEPSFTSASFIFILL